MARRFCRLAIVDLSSFYLDVLKDRMYTFAPSSLERRSAQTVLWQITETLVRLVAPIMSFTADEVWEYLPKIEGREKSVHLALFPKPEEIFSENPAVLLEEWGRLFDVRDQALVFLEEARKEKKIGKALEAELQIGVQGEWLPLLRKYEGSLKEFINVSRVHVVEFSAHIDIPEGSNATVLTGQEFWVAALPASGTKCARCWNFMPEVANYGIWENVCTRCSDALTEMKIEPPAEVAQ